MYYDFIQKYKKNIAVYTAVLLVFIILISLWTFVDRAGKTAVVVSVVPRDSEVLIGSDKKGNGTHYLKPGTYTVEVKKNGFQTQKRTIIVSDNKDQNVVAVSLGPNSPEAKKWAEDNSDEYKKNEEFGAIEADVNGKYFSSLHPITKQLPFVDPYFTISYIANPDMTITLRIDTPSPRYRYYAIAKLRSLGYDPADFAIQFKDFRNPLESP